MISPEILKLRAAAAENLLVFCRYIDEQYTIANHIVTLSDKLMRLERDEIDRLIIEMPPRHGKSELANIKFIPWFLGRNPHKRVLMISNSTTRAQSFSRRARNVFDEFAPRVFRESIAADSSAVGHWDVENKRGGVVAVGAGAFISGTGADLLVIDDAIASVEQAYSKQARDNLWDWYTHEARTRLHPHGKIVIINTRWHADDMCGRLIKQDAENWQRITMPAINENNEALWPQRYDLASLQQIKNVVGARAWSALYQQVPMESGGEIIKRESMQMYDSLPENASHYIQSWDLSFGSINDSASYVVGQVWCRSGNDYYLIDQIRKRMDFVATIEAIKYFNSAYPRCLAIIVENKANGPAVIDSLKKTIPKITPWAPKGSKESRLISVSPMFEGGNVYFPHKPFFEDIAYEITHFPTAENDDIVDATSMALQYYTSKNSQGMSVGAGWIL